MSEEVLTSVSRRYRLQRAEGKSLAFWGVILLSVTEGVLFLCLLFSYYYLWSTVSADWPPGSIEPPSLTDVSPWNVLIRSAVLLSSSFTIWRAEHALKQGERRRVWFWTITTVVMAAYFLAGHIHEFTVTVPSEFLWSDHAYGSLYYTILNFHGAHVTVGILIWIFVMIRLGRGAYGPENETQFSTASIYWHFVDGVWVFILSTLYLFPNFLAQGG